MFARVSIGISSSLNAVCDAITYGAAGARSPLVATCRAHAGARISQANPQNAAEVFLTDVNAECSPWLEAAKQFTDDTEAQWRLVGPEYRPLPR